MMARRAIPIPPNKAKLSRRRFLSISAAAAGMTLFPAAYGAGAFPAYEDVGCHLRMWRGVALGADAMLQVHHPDPDKADRMIDACLAEVSRLERIFSLYREDSALCRLNRDGRLEDPPVELVELLGRSNEFSS
jgi:FAD:protein FMN transferase